MKLNANTLADQEANEPSDSQEKKQGKEDMMMTPAQTPKEASPPFILKKKPPPGSLFNGTTPGGNLERAMYDQEWVKPKNIAYK